MEEYFFVAVSTYENLEKCKKYGLAGFPSTINGAWTFSEIKVGDYITFLYGARAYNLYKVTNKEAIVNAKELPPWEPLRFRSGKIVDFPFRLNLKEVRKLEEPIARPEFAYIAESLLLRGGYGKTHFQADQTTLQSVSQMGKISDTKIETLQMPSYQTFIPRFVRLRNIKQSGIFQFNILLIKFAKGIILSG
ncbi:MAG: hypothetical protein QME47_05200 [Candidatus Thermoplasmatota archaeon]|nr:hypothetical protein [Candidatus Thermoplasmatota archaeon]